MLGSDATQITVLVALVGPSFTACLALLAWVVKSLVTVTVELKRLREDFSHLDGRVTNLEHFNGQSKART